LVLELPVISFVIVIVHAHFFRFIVGIIVSILLVPCI
jgi:hypothetical protein